jgi:hypothetical protein
VTVHPYSSTHRILEIGPDRLRKDLGAGARMEPCSARVRGIEDPSREPSAYRCLLGPAGIGVRCFDSGQDWVELERVGAPPLWQIGDFDVWCAVSRWVGLLHTRLARLAALPLVPVLVHDEPFYEAWRKRAAKAGAPRKVIQAHDRACQFLLGLPQTLIHGDLYPSNILVRTGASFTIWPIDWELIGRGPAVLDVAALTSGGWGPNERAKMVEAYCSSANGSGEAVPRGAIEAARLHLCVQWLGTPSEWNAPPEHAHDWRTEALELADLV